MSVELDSALIGGTSMCLRLRGEALLAGRGHRCDGTGLRLL